MTPTGLGATGEGEIQVWYDWVAAQQAHDTGQAHQEEIRQFAQQRTEPGTEIAGLKAAALPDRPDFGGGAHGEFMRIEGCHLFVTCHPR